MNRKLKLQAIHPNAPIDHQRRRQELIDSCARWLKGNSLSESRAEYLANFIEVNVERWAIDKARPAVSDVVWNVRLDNSLEPVITIVAERWYDAKMLAAAKLNIDPSRVWVSQRPPSPVCGITYAYAGPSISLTGQSPTKNRTTSCSLAAGHKGPHRGEEKT